MREREVRRGFEGTRYQTPVGEEESITKQSFQDECDINKMVERHRRNGGVWDHLAKREPTYGDYSKATDLHSAYDLVAEAEEHFMALPSGVRAMVDNSPEMLLRALANEEQTGELARAGLPMVEGYKPPETDDSKKIEPEAKPPSIEGGE